MKMITTGDIKISVLVDKADGVKALRAVHQAFQLDKPRPGAGLPGAGGTGTFQSPAGTGWLEEHTGKRRWPHARSSCPAWKTSSSATCC